MAPVTLVTPRVGCPVSLATSKRFPLRTAFMTPEKPHRTLIQERYEEGFRRRRGRFRLDRRDAAAAVPR